VVSRRSFSYANDEEWRVWAGVSAVDASCERIIPELSGIMLKSGKVLADGPRKCLNGSESTFAVRRNVQLHREDDTFTVSRYLVGG